MAWPSHAEVRGVNEVAVTAWVARHPVGGPFVMGLLGGIIGWPTIFVGSAVTGFIVARPATRDPHPRPATRG